MKKLDDLKSEDKIINTVTKIIEEEYEEIKKSSKTLAEASRKCKKRYEEIAYRDLNLGVFARNVFESWMEKELGNIKCIPEEN